MSKGSVNRQVHGDYKKCKGCGDLYPVSVLDVNGECRDCQLFDPRDHETGEDDND